MTGNCYAPILGEGVAARSVPYLAIAHTAVVQRVLVAAAYMPNVAAPCRIYMIFQNQTEIIGDAFDRVSGLCDEKFYLRKVCEAFNQSIIRAVYNNVSATLTRRVRRLIGVNR